MKSATNLSDGMRNEWVKSFTSHLGSIKKAKGHAETIRDGKKDDLDHLKQGSLALAAFQKYRSIYDALVRAAKAQSRKTDA